MPSTINTVLLALSFVTMVPGCALLWRVYDTTDNIKGNFQRLAQYESCSFLFFWVINALIAHAIRKEKKHAVLRSISIGCLLFITVYGEFVNFNNLNNLRIVEMSSSKQYYIPGTSASLDKVNSRKLLGGLILGYLSLIFGLVCNFSSFSFANINKCARFFWIFSFLLAVPGMVVCWSNSAVPAYNPGSTSDVLYQNTLFQITTVTLVEWIVLSLGLLQNAEDLLSSSAFIFGVYGLYIPVKYFLIQDNKPTDADFIWAGPILCWVATWLMSIAAGSNGCCECKEKKSVLV